MQIPLIVAVTGHRDIVATEIPQIENAIAAFFLGLEARFPDLPIRLLSPLAEGAGRIAARVAIDHGIDLTVPLPMPRELYIEDFRSDASRQEFDRICELGQVMELPVPKSVSIEEIRSRGQARTEQYAQLGMFLSSHCHILLALWDGIEVDRLGGTSHVVHYHLTDEMPGYTSKSDNSPHLLAGNENDLVYHIVCSREQSPGETAGTLEPGDAGYYTASSYLVQDRNMPAAYCRMFERMTAFNKDVLSRSPRDDAESLVALDRKGLIDDAARLTNDYFKNVNELAKVFQRRVRGSLRTIYSLAVLLGMSFLAYSDIDNMQFMIWIFLLLFATGIAVYLVADRFDWHRKYLDYRALAEGLRVQFYWHVAGIAGESGSAFVHDNFLQKQDIEVGWIRNVMRVVSLEIARSGGKATIAGLEYVVEHWIGGAGSCGDGQLTYFQRTANYRARTHRLTGALGLMCLWLGIGVALILALAGSELPERYQTILIACMGTFPLIAAVREAYAHKRADKELIKQYRYMHRLFSNARLRIDQAKTDEQKRAILRSLGTAALDEHAEWILMHRERPLEHSKL